MFSLFLLFAKILIELYSIQLKSTEPFEIFPFTMDDGVNTVQLVVYFFSPMLFYGRFYVAALLQNWIIVQRELV